MFNVDNNSTFTDNITATLGYIMFYYNILFCLGNEKKILSMSHCRLQETQIFAFTIFDKLIVKVFERKQQSAQQQQANINVVYTKILSK